MIFSRILNVAHAATTNNTTAGRFFGDNNQILNILPLIGIFALFYFVMIRPQAKKYQETKNMISSLKNGDKVSTNSGIIGEICDVDQSSATVFLKVSEDVKILIYKSSICELMNEETTVVKKEKEGSSNSK